MKFTLIDVRTSKTGIGGYAEIQGIVSYDTDPQLRDIAFSAMSDEGQHAIRYPIWRNKRIEYFREEQKPKEYLPNYYYNTFLASNHYDAPPSDF